MPPPLPLEDSDYSSANDSDFAPEDHPSGVLDSDVSSSESDKDNATPENNKTKKRPRRGAAGIKEKKDDADLSLRKDAEDVGLENSGDEAIVEKELRRRRKRGKGQSRKPGDADDESGGEGGLIKTRAQRAAECVDSTIL